MGYNPDYSEKAARSHVERCKASGMAMADYCRKHKIRPSTFYSWNKKFKEYTSSKEAVNTSSFITIPLKREPQTSDSIRIVRTEIDVPAAMASEVCTVLTSLLRTDGMIQ